MKLITDGSSSFRLACAAGGLVGTRWKNRLSHQVSRQTKLPLCTLAVFRVFSCKLLHYLQQRIIHSLYFVKPWENEKLCGNKSRGRVFPQQFRVVVLPWLKGHLLCQFSFIQFRQWIYNNCKNRSSIVYRCQQILLLRIAKIDSPQRTPAKKFMSPYFQTVREKLLRN